MSTAGFRLTPPLVPPPLRVHRRSSCGPGSHLEVKARKKDLVPGGACFLLWPGQARKGAGEWVQQSGYLARGEAGRAPWQHIWPHSSPHRLSRHGSACLVTPGAQRTLSILASSPDFTFSWFARRAKQILQWENRLFLGVLIRHKSIDLRKKRTPVDRVCCWFCYPELAAWVLVQMDAKTV